MTETLEATFRIVTPMFIGGADQTPSDGIRPPSVKGALRFWWRALNWGQIRAQASSDESALKALHAEEVQLFGGSAEQGGQGKFLLSVGAENLTCKDMTHVHKNFKDHDAARYLGYGLMEASPSNKKNTQAGQLTRGCFDEDQRFTVKMLFRGHVETSIQEAVIAFGLLGGLGSRARHGMGSVSLESLSRDESEPIWVSPSNPEGYIEAIRRLLSGKTTANALPPYSALSSKARIDVLMVGNSPYKILDAFGRGELMYRSWGKGGMVLGAHSEKRFQPDHDWSKGTRPRGFHPRRVVFGLPHNYGQGASLEVYPEEHKRRASPMLFHVQAIGTTAFAGTSVLLPSTFLPAGEHINAGGTNVPAKIEWNLLTDFLEGKDIKGNLRFPTKARV